MNSISIRNSNNLHSLIDSNRNQTSSFLKKHEQQNKTNEIIKLINNLEQRKSLISLLNTSSIDNNQQNNQEESSTLTSTQTNDQQETSTINENNENETINKTTDTLMNSSYTQSSTLNETLPANWEARVDNLGRVFYIDHSTRTTTWKRPKQKQNESQNNDRLLEKQRLDKRYQSIRRTISNNQTSQLNDLLSSASSSALIPITLQQQSAASFHTKHLKSPTACSNQSPPPPPQASHLSTPKQQSIGNTHSKNDTPKDDDQSYLLKQPGLRFITRSDFSNIIKQNPDSRKLTKQSLTLDTMLQKIRSNPIYYYKKYQHNKELVRFLNTFADTKRALPSGWEMKYDKNNKVFYVDHNTRSTTFIDPRLPIEPLRQSEFIPEMISSSISNVVSSTVGAAMAASSSLGSGSSDSNDELRTPSYRLTKIKPQVPLIPTEIRLSPPNQPPPPLPPPPPPPLPSSLPASIVSQPVLNNHVSYSDRVVAFLQQSTIFEILKKHNVNLSTKQKDKLNSIRNGGRSIYDRMSGDIDLASVISQCEDLIMCFNPSENSTSSAAAASSASSTIAPSTPQSTQQVVISAAASAENRTKPSRRDYQRSFQTKLRNFYRKLESKGYGQGPSKSKIVIRREKLLEDAKVKFMQLSKNDLRKNKIFICFHGEEGLDYGGPAREFFFLLSRELFNPYYGLFEYSASDMYTVQISPMSAFQDGALEWFQFAGRVLGIALIHQYLLDAFFTRPFYKALLKDTNWTLSDLETLDPEYCQSLLWIKENDITDVLDLTFSVTEDKCGQMIERDLKENGRNIQVTEKNKLDYLQRLVKWRVERGVQQQTEALVKGFNEVIDHKLVQIFDARELELVLCGTIEIDVNDWKRNTDYRSGYHQNHQCIIWFWQAVDRFDNEQKLKLLQFVTGTSSIPYEGFAALRGSNGPRKFCIERWGTRESLPRAHTCFNRLDLPPYSSFDQLFDKLLLAIEETSGFSIQ